MCRVLFFFSNNVLTIKVRSNLTAISYVERTTERSIIIEQLWKNRIEWEGLMIKLQNMHENWIHSALIE
jgi:hypothetical protein